MTIDIYDYDPRWHELALRAIDEVTVVLNGWITVVEHVGSTSVPLLAAKPVIDLMAAAANLDVVRAREDVLKEIGYQRVETGMPQRLFYRREGEPVAYHLHVVTAEGWATRNERLLRDHLRQNPDDRDEYGRLKRDLAGAGLDGEAYTRGKTALVQRIVDAARAGRGLPSVDVWED